MWAAPATLDSDAHEMWPISETRCSERQEPDFRNHIGGCRKYVSAPQAAPGAFRACTDIFTAFFHRDMKLTFYAKPKMMKEALRGATMLQRKAKH